VQCTGATIALLFFCVADDVRPSIMTIVSREQTGG